MLELMKNKKLNQKILNKMHRTIYHFVSRLRKTLVNLQMFLKVKEIRDAKSFCFSRLIHFYEELSLERRYPLISQQLTILWR